jgi:hypothetical protein
LIFRSPLKIDSNFKRLNGIFRSPLIRGDVLKGQRGFVVTTFGQYPNLLKWAFYNKLSLSLFGMNQTPCHFVTSPLSGGNNTQWTF